MKVFTGKVISKSQQKTVTVVVERVVSHPVYKKRFKVSKKYHVHDEFDAKVGDTVKFAASKPYSKLKKWAIVEEKQKTKSNGSKKKKEKGGTK